RRHGCDRPNLCRVHRPSSHQHHDLNRGFVNHVPSRWPPRFHVRAAPSTCNVRPRSPIACVAHAPHLQTIGCWWTALTKSSSRITEVLNERRHRVSGELAQAEGCHQEALGLAHAISSAWNEDHAPTDLGHCALATSHATQTEAFCGTHWGYSSGSVPPRPRTCSPNWTRRPREAIL